MIKRKLSLKSARYMSGLTADQVATMVGLNRGTLYEYENYHSYPRVDVARQLASVYGIKFEDLNFFQD